jgi:general secretion pathway protein B
MSYILEALRRAETERERRRRVPGLHAQPVPVLPSEEAGARHGKPWLWVGVGLGAAVLVALLWQAGSRDSASEEAPASRGAVAGNVTPHTGTVTTDAAPPSDAPTAVAAPAVPNAAAAPPAATQPPPSLHPTHPAPKAALASPKAGASVERARAPATTAHAATSINPLPNGGVKLAPAAATASASAPEPRLRSLAELPDELRRSVPQLAFGGSVYSETAAQRMVIFNGQVLREGDSVTDELLIEQIRPHSVVLRLRGQRFEVAF